jgi:hypothetical protein
MSHAEDVLLSEFSTSVTRLRDIAAIGTLLGSHSTNGIVNISEIFGEFREDSGITRRSYEVLEDSIRRASEQNEGASNV